MFRRAGIPREVIDQLEEGFSLKVRMGEKTLAIVIHFCAVDSDVCTDGLALCSVFLYSSGPYVKLGEPEQGFIASMGAIVPEVNFLMNSYLSMGGQLRANP